MASALIVLAALLAPSAAEGQTFLLAPFNPQFRASVQDPTTGAASPVSLTVTQADREPYLTQADLYFPADWFANPSAGHPSEVLGSLALEFNVGGSTQKTIANVIDHNGHADPDHPTADGHYHWIANDLDTGVTMGEGSVWKDPAGTFVVHVEIPTSVLVQSKAADARLLKAELTINASLANGDLIENPSNGGTHKFSARFQSELGDVVTRSAAVCINNAALEGPPPTTTYRDQVLSDAPWGYWRVGESIGDIASDATGNGHDGTYVGCVGLGVPGALPTDPDAAARFDGASNYVAPLTILNTPTVTVEAWVKITAAPSSNALIAGFVNGLGSGITDKRLIIGSDRAVSWYVWDGAERWAWTSPGAVPLNTWTHIVGTADGTTSRLYVNGVEAMSVPAGPTYAAYTAPNVFITGRDSQATANTSYLAGDIDEVAVYTSALSSHRIQAHYTAAG